MKREFRRWGGVGALLVAASPCYAADADDGLDSLPVVLSASRLRQPVDEAPAPVTVIDRQMIEASGFRTIPDLLRLVPGFLVGYINGNTASVTNQGLADAYSRQMQVLIDGRSIYSPLFGGVYWNDIPITLGDIERIEVVRGPNAASFGANSFLGVINIITKEPGAEQGSHLEWITGNDGVSQLTYRQAGGSGDWRYRGTVSQDTDRGFAGIDDSQRTDRANFRGEYQLNPVDQLQFQMGYAGGTRGEATRNYDVRTPSNRGVNSGFAQIRWTRRNSTDDEMWIQYSHDQRSASEKAVIPIGGLIGDYVISSDMDTRRDDLEAQRTLAVGDSVRMNFGGQLRWDSVRSLPFLGTNAWVENNLSRFFVNAEWRLPSQVILSGGVMYEKSTLTNSSFSPRLAANWEFMPHHTLRFSWGRAERSPTLLESKANWNFHWNGLLLRQNYYVPTVPSSEKIESVEVAYLGELPDVRLGWEARLFSNKIEDRLNIADTPFPGQLLPRTLIPPCPCAQTFVNQDKATLRGADYTLRRTPFEDTKIYFAGAALWVISDNEDIVNQTPGHTASLLIDQRLPGGLRLGAGLYHVGPMRWGGGGDFQSRYRKADVNLSYRIQLPGGQRAEIAWVTENATRPSTDYYRYLQPSRISTLRLSLDF